MCGRFSLTAEDFELKERFGVEVDSRIYTARYNAAPSQLLPVITNQEPGKAQFFRWGLIPFWAKEPSIGYKMINARAESLAQKPAFKQPLQKRRCLIPATGFFEWRKSGEKQPFYFHLNDNELFAFAGLWEKWKDAEENEIFSFTIITTAANAMVNDIHHRMPVILPPGSENEWINDDDKVPAELLKPYDYRQMSLYPVSKKVNKPENDTPDILKPQKETGTLF